MQCCAVGWPHGQPALHSVGHFCHVTSQMNGKAEHDHKLEEPALPTTGGKVEGAPWAAATCLELFGGCVYATSALCALPCCRPGARLQRAIQHQRSAQPRTTRRTRRQRRTLQPAPQSA